MRSDLGIAIRELARQLQPVEVPVRLMQGVIESVPGGSTASLFLAGGTTAVGGWRWISGITAPAPGDVVWIIDGGPGSRFIIGKLL